MNLVLVESSAKAKKIRQTLNDLSLDSEFRVGFSAGRVFDYAVNDRQYQWKPISPDTHSYLKKSIAQCSNVIAMTDGDEQGEYIGFQIQTIAAELNKPFAKSDLRELTVKGVLESLRNTRPLDYGVVDKVHTERLLNLKIAQYGIEKGVGRISIHKMMISNHLLNSDPLFQLQINVDDVVARGLTHTTSLNCAAAEIHEVPPRPCSTYDLMSHCAFEPNVSLQEVASMTQELYENGLLSYSRVDDVQWYPSAEEEVRDLIESQGYLFDQNLFHRFTDINQVHSALYITSPSIIHSNRLPVEIVKDFTNASLSVSNRKLFQGDAGGPILSVDKRKFSEGLMKATPEQQILQSLKTLQLYKASQCANHCHKLSKALFNKGDLNKEAIKFQNNFTKTHFPALIKHVQEKTVPIPNANSGLSIDTFEPRDTKKVQSIFDDLTMRR